MVTEVTNMEGISKGMVLVDFYTTTCGPCKAMSPILDEISKEHTELRVAKVEVTQNPDVSQYFGIMSVPTVIFMKDCKVKQVIRGLSTKKAIKSMIENCVRD